MNKLKTSKPAGILNADYFKKNFSLSTFYPKEHLKDYIEHYWLISWKLPEGISHTQDVIPHPNTHLTFLKGNSHIQGICKQKYTHTLEGNGNIVGIKFKPAGFFPFAEKAGLALSAICDNTFDINKIFNLSTLNNKSNIAKVEQHILALDEPTEKIDYLDELLFSLPLKQDENIKKLNEIVASIEANHEIMKVSDICKIFNMEPRYLQRLFVKYIGVSAKWVINRYRMHDALTSVESNKKIDWATLAIQLGYYDQAHFIKDFKSMIGKTPKDYHLSIGE